MIKRVRRILLIVLGVLVVLVVSVLLAGTGMLRGSLALLHGERTLPGLTAEVLVERDAQGVPTLRAQGRDDLARALGYVHAQERFFQMDMLRRAAAGELAELLGAPLLDQDRNLRRHRFRERGNGVLAGLDPEQIRQLAAYTDGVNAGLADLDSRPFEYLLLRVKPEPWQPVDSILVLYAMFLDLSLAGVWTEAAWAVVADTLPPELADFLLPVGCRWDAPLQGEPLPLPPLPSPAAVNLRADETAPPAGDGDEEQPAVPRAETAGSNCWAVAGDLTAHGGALLANDMHLGLQLPNIWFRAVLEWTEPRPGSVVGVTLPGTPALIAGSNGHVAWGFTNSYGDWLDLITLETDPVDESRYLTPGGWRQIDRLAEIIAIKGADPDTLWLEETIWGPVWERDHRGRPVVLRWVAHDREAVDFRLMDLAMSRDVDQAVVIANRSGIPPQSFICADRYGDIAWTVAGRIPRREGYDGRLPRSWADGTCSWRGYLSAAEYPRVIRPAEGRLWGANARAVGGTDLERMGDSGYGLGSRSRQIRDDLRALDRPVEADMLAVQLDDRALFLDEWRQLVLQTLAAAPAPADSAVAADRTEFLRLVTDGWSGRANPESIGYRVMVAYEWLLRREVMDALTKSCRQVDDSFDHRWLPQRSGVVWELVTRQPPHLLDPYYRDWTDLLLQIIDRTMERVEHSRIEGGDYRWGVRNTIVVAHPFGDFIPQLSRWLATAPRELPGGSHMPRVQHPHHGASERLVVSPGREEDGLFHMPGGQSGHPLSPFFLAGHTAWEEGQPTPLLPGPGKYLLILQPDTR